MSARRRGSGFVRRDALHNWSLHFGPNMTPMVDVVMVILVFFMASAAFLGVDWFLPASMVAETGKSASAPPDDPFYLPPTRVTLSLDADESGVTRVTGLDLKGATMAEFEARFAAMPRGEETAALEVVVKPTGAVAYPDVVKVFEVCRATGIRKVGLSGG